MARKHLDGPKAKEEKIELKPLPKESSTLVGYHYDKDSQELVLAFKTKLGIRSYLYTKVPKTTVVEFLAADSHGVYFHAHIKDKFETIKL